MAVPKWYIRLIFKILTLSSMIGAASLWITSGVNSRPKQRDEQTIVAGAIWSQILIPLGMIISTITDDKVDVFIHTYFLVFGVVLLFFTSMSLIYFELKRSRPIKSETRTIQIITEDRQPQSKNSKITTTYFGIAIFCLAASIFTAVDLIILLV